MSDTPIKDSIDKLNDLPAREAEIGVVKNDKDFGVQGSWSTPIGKDWSFGAAGQWMKEAGWSLAAKFGWKGK